MSEWDLGDATPVCSSLQVSSHVEIYVSYGTILMRTLLFQNLPPTSGKKEQKIVRIVGGNESDEEQLAELLRHCHWPSGVEMHLPVLHWSTLARLLTTNKLLDYCGANC